MHPLIPHGFAVAALLALAPCAKALSITETFNQPIDAFTTSPIYFVGFGGSALKFDPLLYKLTSIEVSYSGSYVLTKQTHNFSNVPLQFTPSVSVSSGYVFAPPGGATPVGGDTEQGSPVIIAPNSSAVYSATLADAWSIEITSPARLAFFTQPGPGSISFESAFAAAGGAGDFTILGNAQGTVKYNYTAIPDSGYTLALCGCAMGFIFAISRRRYGHS